VLNVREEECERYLQPPPKSTVLASTKATLQQLPVLDIVKEVLVEVLLKKIS